MTWVLEDLPFQPRDYELMNLDGGKIAVFPIRQNQIICWGSLTRENYEWNDADGIPYFPIIIDTGNGRNFNIHDEHVVNWAKAKDLDEFQAARRVMVNGFEVSLRTAALWIHRNIPGDIQPDKSKIPFRIDLPDIEVLPKSANFPRLPLLGVRALHIARLELTVNGYQRRVFLREISNPVH